MTNKLKDLKPQEIFYYFNEISQIPRASGNEQEISNYMVNFAKTLGLWVKQDEHYNVYIKKPATPGYEHMAPVILQGHLDMVCEKNKDTDHDFDKEGLDLYIDGDFIRAKGTTLGADNGIAIAYQMAILSDTSLEHPPIEVLMTTAEETGMFGANGMHAEYLEGKTLLNLDTDVEGEFLVSCAGGARITLQIPVQKEDSLSTHKAYKVVIKGLNGGHSGADIHKERANANVLMGRLLKNASLKCPSLRLFELHGGSKDNVITREAEVCVSINLEDSYCFSNLVKQNEADFKKEYVVQDAGLIIELEEIECPKQVVDVKATKVIIDALVLLPYGVLAYSTAMDNLVETSSNIGVTSLEDNVFKVTLSVRSSVATKKEQLLQKITTLADYLGATYTISGQYPAWEYKRDSKIRGLATEVYEKLFNEKPEIRAIHAGLECGLISEKMPDVDMIAFGPNVYDIHSPDERASISSMSKIYHFLTQLLKAMK